MEAPQVQSAVSCLDVRAWALALIADLGRRGTVTMRVQPDGSIETRATVLDPDAQLSPAGRQLVHQIEHSSAELGFLVPTKETVAEARAAGVMKYHPWTDRNRVMVVTLLLATPAILFSITFLVLVIPRPNVGHTPPRLVMGWGVLALIFWVGTYLAGSTVRGLTPDGRRLRTRVRLEQRHRLQQLRTGSPGEVAALVHSSLPEMLAVGPLAAVVKALAGRADCTFVGLTWCTWSDGSPIDGPGLAQGLTRLASQACIPYTGPVGEGGS